MSPCSNSPVFKGCSLLLTISLLLLMPGTGITATTKAVPQKGKGQGKFKVVYEKIKNPAYQEMLKELRSARALETIAEGLNEAFALPKDVTITFGECGEPNAFYDPQKQRITMCFELIERFTDVFKEDVQSEDELDEAVIGATMFVLFHELGHALVDVCDLPITGKEEDAVDQLSTLLLVGDEDGDVAALNGARYWYLEFKGNDNDLDDLQFADEHSMDGQRFYNIMCWVYGNNPQKFDFIVKEGALPESRAVRCGGEFQRIEKAWGTMLAPYVK